MKNLITIDVIIPTYNYEKYILQAIESVQKQTFLPAKIIVVDDGSSDNTEMLVRQYASRVPVVYVKKENGGPNSARNLGLKHVESDYVAFLDADDIWQPEKLEKQVAVFKNTNFSNLGAIYCAYALIDEDGVNINNLGIVSIEKNMRGMIFSQLLEANKIVSSASGILIKRECFDEVGLFDEKLRIGEDWDMWLRLAEAFEYDFVDETLVKIRKHTDNTQNNEEYVFKNELKFYEKWSNILKKKNIKCPRLWANLIAVRVIKRLPKTDFLKLVDASLNKTTRQNIFHLFFGLVRLQIFAVASYIFIVDTVSLMVSFAVQIKRYFKKVLLILFK